MKIQDLLEATIFDERILQNTKWDSPTKLKTWLTSNGFKKIGGGVFSSVFAKPSHNRVVKISMRGDECWLKFAKWFLTKHNNPHVPNVPWLKEYTGKRKGKEEVFFVTVIEKLEPYSTKIMREIKDPVPLAALLFHGYLDPSNRRAIRKHLATLGFDNNEEIKELLTEKHDHNFLKTLHQIKKIGGASCANDLHIGNFMFRRSNNALVITDPLAGYWSE